MTIFSDPRYQGVVVHDLRTPLNVIQLALRMLGDSPALRDTETAEDLAMIRSNTLEIERMLVHLIDFSDLPATSAGLALDTFDVRRLLDEVVEEFRNRHAVNVQVDVQGAPTEVTLDYLRVRTAFSKVLANVEAASMGSVIRIGLHGGPNRCVTSFRLDVPPRDSVSSHEIDPAFFERVLGTAAERRSLELSIASKISKLFKGVARLEAVPGQGTSVVLDWPSRLERNS